MRMKKEKGKNRLNSVHDLSSLKDFEIFLLECQFLAFRAGRKKSKELDDASCMMFLTLGIPIDPTST